MRRKIALLMTLIMVLTLIPLGSFAAQHQEEEWQETVAFTLGEAGYWMGETWVASDATPYIQADRIMVPVAHASRALGAEVLWKAETKEVEVKHHEDTYTLTIGSTRLQKNGEALEEMDTIPVIQNIGNGLGRTMLPVSRLARVLNVEYTWDADTKTARFLPMAEEDGPVTYDEAGTYGPEEDFLTMEGDVHITAGGIVLQNMVITGTLTIDEDVEEDTLVLHNVIVDKVIILGPGMRLITRGNTYIKELIITKTAKETTLETSDDTTIDKAVVDGENAVFEGGKDTVKKVEGDEKDSLVDKDNVVVTTRISVGGSRRSSSSDDDDEEIVEEYVITDAEVSITTGSIVFGYTFYEEDDEVTYLEATEAPYYLDALNSHVELISGDDKVVQHFQQLNPTDDGQVVYEDLEDIIDSWWGKSPEPFMPDQIRIYLTPTEDGEWEAFEVVRDLSEGEKSLFTPPVLPPSEFAGGDGTEENPFLIATADHLNNIKNYLGEDHTDKHFKQISDIDLSYYSNWYPIGNSSNYLTNLFQGSYDGNHKVISNLIINRQNSDNNGLFGRVGDATFKNINLINVNISGKASTGSLIGAAVPNMPIIITNVNVSGEVKGTGHNTGGVAGYIPSGNISVVTVSGEVIGGNNSTGGVVGNFGSGIIDDASSKCSVTGKGSTGGLIGSMAGGLLKSSSATGNVMGQLDSYTGGLVGEMGYSSSEPAIIEDSYAVGTVAGTISTGGLIGGMHLGLSAEVKNKVIRSFFQGSVEGSGATAGGLVGLTDNNTAIENCYATGDVAASTQVGGLVGQLYGTIINTYSSTTLSGNENVGGLIGYRNWGTQITNSYFDTSVAATATGTGIHTGSGSEDGITGYSTSAMIKETNNVDIYVDWVTDWVDDEVWAIEEGESYPYLTWQGTDNIPYPPPEFAGGEGTAGNPYQVETANHLNNVRNHLNKHFIQIADINLGVSPWNVDEGWQPIGSDDSFKNFSGSYNGNGFVIDHLTINSNSTFVGLFKYLLASGKIENVTLENASINGTIVVGAIVSHQASGSIIQNCSVEGSVSGNNTVGGLVGQGNGSIIGSYSSGSVVLKDETASGVMFGGLVSRLGSGAIVQNSYSSSEVHGKGYVGGLVGYLNNATIELSYATGQVTGIEETTSDYVGGLVGRVSVGTISKSYATGNVSSGRQIGGLVGSADSSAFIKESYAEGTVSGEYGVGGLVGTLQTTTGVVENSYASGAVSGDDGVGGLVGATSSGIIRYSYSTGSVQGNSNVGGLVSDYNNPSEVTSSYWDITTSGVDTETHGTGYTSAQMKNPDNFINWDFPNIWTINSTGNDGYPALAWQGFDHSPVSDRSLQTVTQQVYDADEISMNLMTPGTLNNLSITMEKPEDTESKNATQFNALSIPAILVQHRKLI